MRWCGTCGQPWRLHPRQPCCPRCGDQGPARGLIDPWRGLLLGRAWEGPRGVLLLLRLALWPPVLDRLEELRRCVACAAEQFGPAAPCARCGGETVGQDLGSAADGSDLRAQELPWLRGVGGPFLLLLALSWALALGGIGRAFLHYQGPVRPLLALAGWGFAGLMAHVALVQAARVVRVWRAGPLPPPLDPAALTALLRDFLRPFLERHAIPERGSLERGERELGLLGQALAAEGVTLAPDRLRAALVAAALGRDQERLARRVEEERQRAGGLDGLTAFARVVDPGADAALTPALCDLLTGLGEPLAGLAGRLRAVRERLRLQGFVRDLERRRGEQ